MQSKDLSNTSSREMKYIALFSEFDKKHMPPLFFAKVQDIFINCNALIKQYNELSEPSEKINILIQIQKNLKYIDDRYPARFFAKNTQYRDTHAALFSEIKYQMASMGQRSLLPEGGQKNPLSEIIANMAPEKADELLYLLINNDQNSKKSALMGLYEEHDKSPEADDFRHFLATHSIRYLGGDNSQNWLLTHIDNANEVVLKIDNRLDMPRHIEVLLREKLPEYFSPIHAERHVTCEKDLPAELITRTVQVTNYYPNGSLEQEREQRRNEEPQLIIDSAADKFQQMATILFEIQENGCIHPDAKISNWLVDETGILHIADAKSLAYSDKNGHFLQMLPGNEFDYPLIDTTPYSPPESNSRAQDIHSYTLGINLYEYVSGEKSYKYNLGTLVSKVINYNLDVFREANGALIKELIIGLVDPDPSKRLSLMLVSSKLTHIASEAAFKKLAKLRVGSEDPSMEQFIITTQLRLAGAKNPKQHREILANLNKTINDLEGNKVLVELKKIIKNYRDKASWYTVGMKAKAERIEKALAQIPLDQRIKLTKSSELVDIMKALASHRYPIKGHVFLREGQIDENKAAKKYKEFKTEIEKWSQEGSSSEQETNRPDSKNS